MEGSNPGPSQNKAIQDELFNNARLLCAPGKGILAADESMGTLGKKFVQINLENSEENRRQYRQMLLSNDKINQYISGVILHEETIFQKDDQGNTFVELLRMRKILPGIKVDKGLVTLLGTNMETATQGLDDLKLRCDQYYKLGCRFAKWRAVLRIGTQEPSHVAIVENARGLARYAAICQESRIVPIVEPEVLQDGRHDIQKCQRVSQKVLAATFKALHDYNVFLEGILLKPNMITSGFECPNKANTTEIGRLTITTLLRTVPAAVPGIMFLSGGQSEEEATVNLNTINKFKLLLRAPWALSFSYGRALQNTAVNVWGGKSDNVQKAQQELLKRMQANSMACLGMYVSPKEDQEGSTAHQSMFIAKHSY